LLIAHDLIISPAFAVIKAADEFKEKTTRSNQLWQTDFAYLKVIGWGWLYLSTILDNFSRYIIAWKLCTTMKAEDVSGIDGCLRHEIAFAVREPDSQFAWRHLRLIQGESDHFKKMAKPNKPNEFSTLHGRRYRP
jgi:transposase InsO family protein